jgi:hypothetical protein
MLIEKPGGCSSYEEAPPGLVVSPKALRLTEGFSLSSRQFATKNARCDFARWMEFAYGRVLAR